MLTACTGGENDIAIDLIVLHVHQQLTSRGQTLRNELHSCAHEGQPLPKTLNKLPATLQIQGLHTFIRYASPVTFLHMQSACLLIRARDCDVTCDITTRRRFVSQEPRHCA